MGFFGKKKTKDKQPTTLNISKKDKETGKGTASSSPARSRNSLAFSSAGGYYDDEDGFQDLDHNEEDDQEEEGSFSSSGSDDYSEESEEDSESEEEGDNENAYDKRSESDEEEDDQLYVSVEQDKSHRLEAPPDNGPAKGPRSRQKRIMSRLRSSDSPAATTPTDKQNKLGKQSKKNQTEVPSAATTPQTVASTTPSPRKVTPPWMLFGRGNSSTKKSSNDGGRRGWGMSRRSKQNDKLNHKSVNAASPDQLNHQNEAPPPPMAKDDDSDNSSLGRARSIITGDDQSIEIMTPDTAEREELQRRIREEAMRLTTASGSTPSQNVAYDSDGEEEHVDMELPYTPRSARDPPPSAENSTSPRKQPASILRRTTSAHTPPPDPPGDGGRSPPQSRVRAVPNSVQQNNNKPSSSRSRLASPPPPMKNMADQLSQDDDDDDFDDDGVVDTFPHRVVTAEEAAADSGTYGTGGGDSGTYNTSSGISNRALMLTGGAVHNDEDLTFDDSRDASLRQELRMVMNETAQKVIDTFRCNPNLSAKQVLAQPTGVMSLFYDKLCNSSTPDGCTSLYQQDEEYLSGQRRRRRRRPYFNEVFTREFIHQMTRPGGGISLLYLQAPHSPGNDGDDETGSGGEEWKGRTVQLVIAPGSTGTAVDIQPKLEWSTMSGGKSNMILTTSIPLLKIHSILISGVDEEDEDDLLEEEDDDASCLLTLTSASGDVHMFETSCVEERNHILNGLRNVISRLSFHLITGDATASVELYNDDHAENNIDHHDIVDVGDLPSLPNPRLNMNRIAHALLDS